MEKTTQQMTVTELTTAIMPLVESKGYHSGYVHDIRCILNQLVKFCEKKGESQFNTELGQRFLEERYGVARGTTSHRHSQAHRAMDMLSAFQQYGTVMLRRRKNRVFPSQFAGQVHAYFDGMHRNFLSDNTIKSHTKVLHRLTEFLDAQGVPSTRELTLEPLNSYIKMVLCNYSKEIVRGELGIMRRFLRFLYNRSELTEDLAARLPKLRISSTPSHLPSTFTPEEVRRLLATVDRNSPSGKRDYAVLMLAAKLGLRTSDIKNLKHENIEWDRHAIHLTQVKTGEPLALPLPSDVGWALIDHIKNGRPISDAPEIFLRAVAPYISLQNFDNILIKAMRCAGIPLTRTTHHGLHTLRHSLATTMLQQETPIHVIQEVLGHVNSHTTKRYTSVDIRQLKTCTLEVPEK